MKTILYNTNTYCPPGGAGVSQYFQPKLYKVDGYIVDGTKIMRENTNTYCPLGGAGGPTLRSITME